MTIVKQSSSSRSPQINQLVIYKAIKKDSHCWGNVLEREAAFLIYLDCLSNEVVQYIQTLRALYCCWYEIHSSKDFKLT